MKIYTRSKNEADFIGAIAEINQFSKESPLILIDIVEKLKIIPGMDVFNIANGNYNTVIHCEKDVYVFTIDNTFTKDRRGEVKKRRIDHILRSVNSSLKGTMVTAQHEIGQDLFYLAAVKGQFEKSRDKIDVSEKLSLDQLGEETPSIKEALDQVLLLKKFTRNYFIPTPQGDSFDEDVLCPVNIDNTEDFPDKTSNYSLLDWVRIVALYCMLDRNRSKSYVEKMVGKNISAEMMIGIGVSIYGKKGPMIAKEEFASIFGVLKDPSSLKIYKNFQNYVNTVFEACMRAGKSIATPMIDKSDLIKEYKEVIESSRRVILMNSEIHKGNVITKQRNVI